MIPKLLDSEKTLAELASDRTEGLGRLPEATVCKVTEERNGAYYLEMTLPIEAKHYKDITLGGIITAKPNTTDDPQMFRICKVTRPLNGLVQIRANHISYDLNKTSVRPFEATGAANALRLLKSNMTGGAAFTFSTTIDNTSSTFRNTVPQSARALMGGQQGSLLDVFGGEYRYNGLTVQLMNNRGENRGVRIAYGKNLTDIKQEENIESMYTAVVPYVTSNEQIVIGDLLTLIETAEPRIYNLDLSSRFQGTELPSKTEVNKAAAAYVKANNLREPNISISVSFVNLADTEEYKNIAPLERVSLCDTVSVYFEKLNISATAKVNKTVYDVLAERYQSIELGNARASLSSTINNSFAAVKEEVSQQKNFFEKAIEEATQLISGGLGGYVVMKTNAAGQPEEILIMDTDSTETATNVIRMNKEGIGFSRSGYNGPFISAWTIDGKFNADFIRSGTIEAINIVGSLIRGSTMVFGKETDKQVTVSGIVDGILFSGDGNISFGTSGVFDVYNSMDVNGMPVRANQLRIENVIEETTGRPRNQSSFVNFEPYTGKPANGFKISADEYHNIYDAVIYNERDEVMQNQVGVMNTPTSTRVNIANHWPGAAEIASRLEMDTTTSKTTTQIYNTWNGVNRISSLLKIETDANSSSIGMYTYNQQGGAIGSISAGANYYMFGVYGATYLAIDTSGNLIISAGGESHYARWQQITDKDGYTYKVLVAA